MLYPAELWAPSRQITERADLVEIAEENGGTSARAEAVFLAGKQTRRKET